MQHRRGLQSFARGWELDLGAEAELLYARYLREHGQALGESGPEAPGPASPDAGAA